MFIGKLPFSALAIRALSLTILFSFSFFTTNAQAGDCPYPIIFVHGWISNQTTFSGTYNHAAWQNVFGTLEDNGAATDHVFHAMLNATSDTHVFGADEVAGTSDDDVLVVFDNETNDLLPGCAYATNFESAWNEDANNPVLYHGDGSAIGFFESDSNESAIVKQGYALSKAIEKVLAANPGKEKVILIGHSMGGLAIREYLQRASGGTPTWWIDPSSPDGHKVAVAATTSTPHRGSNTLGNLSVREDDMTEDAIPDIVSEAVRDLRYSWGCGFGGLFDCTGAYLFGGAEDASFGWRNEDVDCNGNDTDGDIVGINIDGTIQGTGDEWDGTYENPAMPLPNNIHYTWQVSPTDGVVSTARQYIYNGNVMYPTDGVSGRLTDSTMVSHFHTAVNGSPDEIIRNLDEGDYPFFAFGVNMDKNYICLPHYRPNNAAEWTSRDDPDWYSFEIPAGFTEDFRIGINTNPNVATTLDYFPSNPGDYTSMNTPGAAMLSIPEGGGSFAATELIVPNAQLNIGGTNYIRINHANTNGQDWRTPTTFILETAAALPVEWLSFTGNLEKEAVYLDWKAMEINTRQYEIERSPNGIQFEKIGEKNAQNKSTEAAAYTFIDEAPRLGTNYYRIRSVDIDGSMQFSKIISIEYKKAYFEVGNAYPIPTADVVLTEIYAPQNEMINVLIMNTLGQVLTQKMQLLEAGNQEIHLDLSDYPTGIYSVLFVGATNRQEVKLVKQ